MIRPIRVSDDIVPISEFRARASKVLEDAANRGAPLIITQNGRPAGVLLSPAEFDRMRERERFLEAVAEGLAAADAGRTLDTAEVRRKVEEHRSRRKK